MKTKITINALSMTSIYDALFNLEQFRKRLERLVNELPQALATYGMIGASVRFAEAPRDILLSGSWSYPNIMVTAEPFTGEEKSGWRVLANGEEVCFVEFGAGVYYNGGNASYLGRRPKGIVGIGRYGKGQGKQDVWVFKKNGEKFFTQGTPASNALYYTGQEIRRRIEEEARRILNE